MIFRTITFSKETKESRVFVNEIYQDEAEMDADDIVRVLSYYTDKQDYLASIKAELVRALRANNKTEVNSIIQKSIAEIEKWIKATK